jgi:hypothetical protein
MGPGPNTVKFGQLVQEQHAVMRERDLARPDAQAAADERCQSRRMVWIAKRPRAHQLAVGQEARDGVDHADFERLLCHVAGVKIYLMDGGTPKKMGLLRRLHCLFIRHFKQPTIPCLIYFRNRFDRKLLTFLGFVVTALFLFLVCGAIGEWGFLNDQTLLYIISAIFSLTIIIVFITAACAYPLLDIQDRCTNLLHQLGDRGREVIKLKMNTEWEGL